ncbi:DUF2157 domain-containing protein [Bacillus solimangrovi]|uniref:DUF2157 domain-containing protein n=1 Tax=Bacillus solimangrovi TaxID=1305675 RepID=A0A1E5LI32_9BACI|nr:DUF2157 domain-containing protein [Bacillus solimangrovi]OEH93744.1 hypothetical protein BFG57_11195 [Bacillus solimangrovi]
MKRNLSHVYYHFLKKELTTLEENGKLQPGQTKELMSNYVINNGTASEKKNVNPMSIILSIGAILIGLSILSFVASNWSALTSVTKFVLLLALLIGFYLAGFRYETRNKNLSRVFYYIGAFAYGAEIIYIGQLFHLGGEMQTAFLFWGIGVLPLGFYLKDQVLKLIGVLLIYLFLHMQYMFVDHNGAYVLLAIIPLMFAFNHYVMKSSKFLLFTNIFVLYEFVQIHVMFRPLEMDRFPFELIVIIPALFFFGHKLMNKSVPIFVVNLFFSLEMIGLALDYFIGVDAFTLTVLIFFIIGITLTYIQVSDYRLPMKNVGMILQIITGFALTFPHVWTYMFEATGDKIAIIFSILYVLYNLYYVKQGKLIHITIFCALILRFYVDLSLAFINKSIAFFTGGVLLIGLALWIERTRKKEVMKREEA